MEVPPQLHGPRMGLEPPNPVLLQYPPPFFHPPPPTSTNPTCNHCKISKIRCERIYPCSRCIRLNLDCRPQPKRRRGQPAQGELERYAQPYIEAPYAQAPRPQQEQFPPVQPHAPTARASVYPVSMYPGGGPPAHRATDHAGMLAPPRSPAESSRGSASTDSTLQHMRGGGLVAMSNAEDGLNEFLRDCSWDEGAATCAAVWKRGHLELLCNDRFASMYIGRLAMEKDLVDGDIGPASICSRVVPRASRDAFLEHFNEACTLALRDQHHDSSKFLTCVDRFGLETICLIRVQAHASACNMYTAIIMHIKPTPSPRNVASSLNYDQPAAAPSRQVDSKQDASELGPVAKRAHVGV